MKKIITLDIGTTVVKSVVFETSGKERDVFERPVPCETPHPGRVEQDPHELLAACHEVLEQAFGRYHEEDVAAIALTAQGGSMIPCAEDGTPVHPMITWLDERARDLVEQWEQSGEAQAIRRITGWSPQPGLPYSTIQWLRREEPDVFANTKRWLSVNDFVAGHLTGRFVTNLSCAAEMLLIDLETDDWSPDMIERAGLGGALFSRIETPQSIIGGLASGARRSIGIQTAVPVVNGGQDHSCEALALGVTEPGWGMLACGTAWVINVAATERVTKIIPNSMDLNYHVLDGLFIASSFLGGYGKWIDWLAEHIVSDGGDAKQRYESLERVLEASQPGAHGLRFDPRTKSMSPLSPGHDRSDLARALMEGLVGEVHRASETLRAGGLVMRDLWMIGGAAKNRMLPQLMADALNMRVHLTSYSHGPSLGAAMLALQAIGETPDAETARQRFNLEERIILPGATARREQEDRKKGDTDE